VIIVPKYRKKAIFGSLRTQSGKILREICEQGGIEVVEGHGMVDHVHLCLSIPPKYSVATAVGRMKGKSAIRIHRACLGRAQHVTGFHVWAKGYGPLLILHSERIRLEVGQGVPCVRTTPVKGFTLQAQSPLQ
jgi:putative transposase